MRLRGLAGARDEFHLAAIVQNLKTMAGDTVADVADKLWVADCAMVNLLKLSAWRQRSASLIGGFARGTPLPRYRDLGGH